MQVEQTDDDGEYDVVIDQEDAIKSFLIYQKAIIYAIGLNRVCDVEHCSGTVLCEILEVDDSDFDEKSFAHPLNKNLFLRYSVLPGQE